MISRYQKSYYNGHITILCFGVYDRIFEFVRALKQIFLFYALQQ
jgi:hypothetical protein